MKSNFMPTYLKYKYIFPSFRIKVGSGLFSAEPDPDPGKKCWILTPLKMNNEGGKGEIVKGVGKEREDNCINWP